MLSSIYLCGEVAACLELLEEGGHEDGGEEQDNAPKEHIRNVRAMGTTGGALELSMQHLALLLAPDDDGDGDGCDNNQHDGQKQERDNEANRNG